MPQLLSRPGLEEWTPVIELLAFLLCLLGAGGIYLASQRQGLLASPLPPRTRSLSLLLALTGLASWIAIEGIGVGLCAALSSLMLTWVVLPYLAWWRCRAAT